MTSEFFKQYEQQFVRTPEELRLEALVRQYNEECEAYDRVVCTGPIRHGEVLPADGRESALINKHSRAVILKLAPLAQVSERDFRSAISTYNSHK